MIVEQRNYTLKPGLTRAYLQLYQERGFEVQTSHLGRLVGYYTTESGELNQLIHMWAYDDYHDRDRRRAALYEDPRWKAVVEELMSMIVRMESRILAPTSFYLPALDSLAASPTRHQRY